MASSSWRSPELPAKPGERSVGLVDHPLLQGDDGVVGDGDALRADFRAALRDVAVTDPVRGAQLLGAVFRVERMHLEGGDVHEEARADELVVESVVAQHVTDVLTEEALDALAELLHAIDVLLHHAPGAVGRVGRAGLERLDAVSYTHLTLPTS